MKKYVVRISVGRCVKEIARCDSLEEADDLMRKIWNVFQVVSSLPLSVEYSIENPIENPEVR